MFGPPELRHIRTDFGDDSDCAITFDTRNGSEELDSIFKIRTRRNHIFYHFINIVDFCCDIIHTCADEAHTVFWGISQLMAGGGVALIGTTLVPLVAGLF